MIYAYKSLRWYSNYFLSDRNIYVNKMSVAQTVSAFDKCLLYSEYRRRSEVRVPYVPITNLFSFKNIIYKNMINA